jgi:DNA-binding CsgD family transcriptional regulator
MDGQAISVEGSGQTDHAVAPFTCARFVAEFARCYRLTERQSELIAGIVAGLSSKEIAVAMRVDYRTVAQHLRRVCRKVGAADRHKLVARIVHLLIARANRRAPISPDQARRRDPSLIPGQ